MTGAFGNIFACTSSARTPVRNTNGTPCVWSKAATSRLLRSTITQLHIEHCKVKFRLAAEQRDSFGCRGNACHVRRAGTFQDLLNVEGDQELVVQHEAALAG